MFVKIPKLAQSTINLRNSTLEIFPNGTPQEIDFENLSQADIDIINTAQLSVMVMYKNCYGDNTFCAEISNISFWHNLQDREYLNDVTIEKVFVMPTRSIEQ